jgi:hypothetical protein
VTESNYSALASSHTLQFTTARTKFSHSAVSSPIVAWWRIPTVSSASLLTFLPAGDCLTTHSLLLLTNSQADDHLTPTSYSSGWLYCSSQLILLITSRHGPRSKHCLLFYFNFCLADLVENTIPLLLFAGRCLETVSVQSLIPRRCLATGLYATVLFMKVKSFFLCSVWTCKV